MIYTPVSSDVSVRQSFAISFAVVHRLKDINAWVASEVIVWEQYAWLICLRLKDRECVLIQTTGPMCTLSARLSFIEPFFRHEADLAKQYFPNAGSWASFRNFLPNVSETDAVALNNGPVEFKLNLTIDRDQVHPAQSSLPMAFAKLEFFAGCIGCISGQMSGGDHADGGKMSENEGGTVDVACQYSSCIVAAVTPRASDAVPGLFSLRGSSPAAVKEQLPCAPIAEAGEIIDSSNKMYERGELCGFTVHYEPGVFDVPGFGPAFVADITQFSCLLPAGACNMLLMNTHVYVNKSLAYGTTKNPIVAKGCCYHPRGGADWLRNNGLNVRKKGCVEIFSAESYLQYRNLWGTGGVLVHEFSHAYHDKHCPDGYNCEEIRNAYNVAMEKKLYDSVHVHGPQGVAADGMRITAKAYACTNCMEFFAELSVAYHYSLDEEEYNKWFPHSRTQLKNHDPDSYAVLDKVWQHYK